MPAVEFNSIPARVRWPVVRGDDSAMGLQFFDTYVRPDDPLNVPSDITGFEYVSHVATGRGDDRTVIAQAAVTVDDAATGQITVSVTDQQTDLFTNSTYIWDLVENPDTSTEHTLICDRMTVEGRATVGSIFDGGDDDPIIVDGGTP